VERRRETRVDFPTPWTPLMPMKKGVEGEEAVWMAWRARMKGMQWLLLSSIISAMLSFVRVVLGLGV
jgi:hypothetical protein